jgi:LuxR family transcriptional regulator, maltose regulon positive regulatory protein
MPADTLTVPVHPRRIDGPPRAVAQELARTSLIQRLGVRWLVPVTAVVAGAGFGKSTMLAQTARLHLANPCGVEAWVTCEPGDEDARRLSATICAALAAPDPAGCPVEAVVEALRAVSPLETCLILDDLHELPTGSSGHRLVGELIRRLPARAHLVLAGRRLPPLPLARLRAADQLAEFGEADLGFGPAELTALARRAGRPPELVAGLGGWPALVRLALVAPIGVAREYLWDEVVSGLTGDERQSLLALAVLGSADAATLSALVAAPVDVAALADRVPLVELLSDELARAHPLWTDALLRMLPADEVTAMRTKAGDLLLRRGDALRAGAIAVGAGDLQLLDRAGTALVLATLATFPHDTGTRWLAGVSKADRRDRPGLLLLDAATRQALRAGDALVDRLVDEAAEAAHRAGDPNAEAAALSLAAIAAHARGAPDRLFAVYQRAVAHPAADRQPALRLLTAGVHAAMAELCGDIDAGLAALEPVCDTPAAAQPASPVTRFHIHLLLLAGRADEAAVMAEARLSRSPYANVRRLPPFARWMAGQPGDLLRAAGATDLPVAPDADTNARFRYNFLTFGVVVAASLGHHDGLRRLWRQLNESGAGADTRDAADLTVAAMARAIAEHDEPSAVALLDGFLAEHPLADPVAAVRLRRFLAYGYVLSVDARRVWDSQPLGPAHQRVRAAARQLVAAREGRLGRADRLVEPETVLTAFPLPWSIELATRAEAAGAAGGPELLQWLTDRLGAGAREELRLLAGSPPGTTPDAARRLLVTMPEVPSCGTRIEVLGPLRVLVDGQPVQPPELRRNRVRQLLALLAVHGQLHRERLLGLLWPDLDQSAAARNLRVTLTYLRRVLEPRRGAGEPGYHLRIDRDTVRLAASGTLRTDLCDLREHLAAVRESTSAGCHGTVEDRLAAIVALWRGDPLSDLADVPGQAAEVSSVAAALAGAALMLGERRLAEGDVGPALHLAERALANGPYDERCLRLVLACELHRRDPAAIDRAVRRVCDALSALRTTGEPATAMLLRQARLGA